MIIRNFNYCKYHNCYCCCYCYRKRSMNFKTNLSYSNACQNWSFLFILRYLLFTYRSQIRMLICRIVFWAKSSFLRGIFTLRLLWVQVLFRHKLFNSGWPKESYNGINRINYVLLMCTNHLMRPKIFLDY